MSLYEQFYYICLTGRANICVPLVAPIVVLLLKTQWWATPKDMNCTTTFRIKTRILNSVNTTRFWTYPWSSVTERILKGERWKGKKCLGCNPPHLCVSLKPGPGWGGLICVHWFKVKVGCSFWWYWPSCRPSLFQRYFHQFARNDRINIQIIGNSLFSISWN